MFAASDAPAPVAPDIILVIGDFMQFMAIRAIYEQRTSGRRCAFYPGYSEIDSRFQLKFYIPQIPCQLYSISQRKSTTKLAFVLIFCLNYFSAVNSDEYLQFKGINILVCIKIVIKCCI